MEFFLSVSNSNSTSFVVDFNKRKAQIIEDRRNAVINSKIPNSAKTIAQLAEEGRAIAAHSQSLVDNF